VSSNREFENASIRMLCGATMEQLLPSGATLAERSISGQFRPAHDDLNSAVIVFRVRYRQHCGRDALGVSLSVDDANRTRTVGRVEVRA
jgi:hypothetical protein